MEVKNILLKNEGANQATKEEIKKYMEANENENMTVQTLWNAAKAVPRGKYIAFQAYLKKQKRSQILNLILHLKDLEKEQRVKPKARRRREIIGLEQK